MSPFKYVACIIHVFVWRKKEIYNFIQMCIHLIIEAYLCDSYSQKDCKHTYFCELSMHVCDYEHV